MGDYPRRRTLNKHNRSIKEIYPGCRLTISFVVSGMLLETSNGLGRTTSNEIAIYLFAETSEFAY